MASFPYDIPYQLFSSCILVKGYNRSCIYDLQRGDFDYIPNSLYEILNSNKGITFQELLSFYDDLEDQNNLKEYFYFLFQKEYIFFTNLDGSRFPNYSIEFHKPYELSTLVIDIDNNSDNYNNIIRKNILSTKPECLVIRIVNATFETILETLNIYDGIPTRIIQLFLSKKVKVNKSQIEKFFETNNRISIIIKHSNAKEKTIAFKKGFFTTTKEDIIIGKEILKDISNFSPNIDLYIESKLHNTFYNKRAYVNALGIIFRFENDTMIFGNIFETKLSNVLTNENFKKYWDIKKDTIQICKDCEYRYMCVDNRLPVKNSQDQWKFEIECNYDPYNSIWK